MYNCIICCFFRIDVWWMSDFCSMSVVDWCRHKMTKQNTNKYNVYCEHENTWEMIRSKYMRGLYDVVFLVIAAIWADCVVLGIYEWSVGSECGCVVCTCLWSPPFQNQQSFGRSIYILIIARHYDRQMIRDRVMQGDLCTMKNINKTDWFYWRCKQQSRSDTNFFSSELDIFGGHVCGLESI